MYKSGSSDDKCIDSQHFGTCDSHTDFKVKSQSHGAGAYCGGYLAAQLVLSVQQQGPFFCMEEILGGSPPCGLAQHIELKNICQCLQGTPISPLREKIEF